MNLVAGQRHLPVYAGLGAGALAAAWGWALAVDPAAWQAAGLLSLALAGGAALFLPPRHMALLFLGGVFTLHLFRSPFLVNIASVEAHPRELLLGLYALYALIRFRSWRSVQPAEPVYLAVLAYGCFYGLVLLVGLLRQQPASEILQEVRYPLFLLSFAPLVLTLRDSRDVWFCARWLCILAALIVAVAIGYFLGTFNRPTLPSIQNALGEFVPRQIGWLIMVAVRPNGHMLFEAAVPILLGLLFCRGESRESRAHYALALCAFGAAIGVTLMRTAWLSTAFSLVVLAWLLLPVRLRWRAAIVGLLAGALSLASLEVLAPERLERFANPQSVSLKARAVENAGAWEAFRAAPVFGQGLGSSFEAMQYAAETSRYAYARDRIQSLHNSWMYYLYKGGALGMLLIATAYALVFFRGMAVADRLVGRDRRLLLGLLAALAGQCLAAAAMARLTYPAGQVFFAMTAAAVVLFARSAEADQKS